MSDEKNKKLAKVPQDGNTKQMDIFRTLLSPDNDPSTLSNLINLWDQIPKYHISAGEQSAWRKTGDISVVNSRIELNNDVFEISISPALIGNPGEGKQRANAFYPSETEEILEAILRKFLLDQNLGVHSNIPQSTWVKFSIRMIREEFKKLGKTRSNAQIRLALEVLSKAVLIIKRNGKRIHTGPILANWIDKPNESLSSEHEDALSAVEFSGMVSKAISALEFRQYDYLTTSKLKNQVARWLMQRISLHFRNAGYKLFAPIGYKINLSEIIEKSLLLNHMKYKRDQTAKVRKAIQELVKNDVLIMHSSQTENESTIMAPDGQTVLDIVFTLYASRDFVSKMTAANKRNHLLK